MKRYVAAALGVLLGTTVGVPAAIAQAPIPIVIYDVQKSPPSLVTPSSADGSDCATFLQAIQKAPYNFKIASMHTNRGPFFIDPYPRVIVYTLDGPVVTGVASEVLLFCGLNVF